MSTDFEYFLHNTVILFFVSVIVIELNNLNKAWLSLYWVQVKNNIINTKSKYSHGNIKKRIKQFKLNVVVGST